MQCDTSTTNPPGPLEQWFSTLEPQRPTKDEYEHFAAHNTPFELCGPFYTWLLLVVLVADNSLAIDFKQNKKSSAGHRLRNTGLEGSLTRSLGSI